ncbi:MAG: exopolyphosphatase [Acidobacteria bacterium]|jgi:nanoRNase/pAp phosphatase (c-di-AMP/oligoRNAs hydrolase)|nr:exopolyphosphatase [Acidobacteriota bacterium]
MRLITRSDFDGLVCGVLLVEAGIADAYEFVHPRDVVDGKVTVNANDVLANIPFVPGCGLWFDHHISEWERLKLSQEFNYKGKSELAPSCARVIYNYYGGQARFARFDESGLMDAVDRSDSGQLTIEDIVNPTDWMLLSFIMDPRTGLGRYKDYRVSNYHLMESMIEYCRTKNPGQILAEPDVRERVNRYFYYEKDFENMLKLNAVVDENVVIINLLNVSEILPGNRFKEFVLFPEQNVAVRIIWGHKKQNVVITCGANVITRTAKTHIGKMLLNYGGGGHPSVGSCQVPFDTWQHVKDEIVAQLKADG